MDGLYLNNKYKYIDHLKTWAGKVIVSKAWNSFEDLHIDQVDPIFQNKANWLSGSVFLLECMKEVLDSDSYEVIAAVPLSCSLLNSKIEVTFSTLNDLQKELDITPPSIYIFPIGELNFKKTIEESEYLGPVDNQSRLGMFYSERVDHDEVYRTVFVKFYK